MSKKIPVFFCTNRDLTSWLAVALVSMAMNTKHKIDLHIVECGITDVDKKIINDICKTYKNLGKPKFYYVNTLKEFDGCGAVRNSDLAAWGRYMFPSLAPNLDKALYMDTDIMVLGDVAKLYNMDLEGYTIAAAPEIYYMVPHNTERLANYQRGVGGSDKHVPFCSGIMVMDLEKWRKKGMLEKLKKIGRENAARFICPDQDSMNTLFADNYKIISNTLVASTFDVNCLRADFTEQFPEMQRNIIVRHFNVIKPWKDYLTEGRPIAHRELFWYYAEKTPFLAYFQMEFSASMTERIINFSNKR